MLGAPNKTIWNEMCCESLLFVEVEILMICFQEVLGSVCLLFAALERLEH